MPSKRHKHLICPCDDDRPNKPSQHNIIYDGYIIDQQNNDKTLPVKKGKLLDKLVHTRAVYDDIRSRILSTSGTETELLYKDVEFNTIQDLVNLVDRGEVPPLHALVLDKLHDDGCNCDNCRSQTVSSINLVTHLSEKAIRDLPEDPDVHMHILSDEEENKYSINFETLPKEKKVPYGSVRSDPCICGNKYKSKLDDTQIATKNKRLHTIEQQLDAYSPTNKHKLDKYNKRIVRSSSKEKLQNATRQIRKSIRSSITALENVFHIKNDSIALYKDKIKKKKEINQWNCDYDSCVTDDCTNQECYQNNIRKGHLSLRKEPKKRILTKSQRKYKTNSNSQECVKECPRILRKSGAEHKLERPHPLIPGHRIIYPSPPDQIALPKQGYSRSIVTSKTGIKKKLKQRKLMKCDCKTSTETTKKKSNAKNPVDHSIPLVQLNKPSSGPYNFVSNECNASLCIPDSGDPFICEEETTFLPTASFTKHVSPTPSGKLKITSISVTKSFPRNNQLRQPKRRKPLSKPMKIGASYAAKSKSSPNARNRPVGKRASNIRLDVEYLKKLPEQIENTKRNNVYNQPIKLKNKQSITDKKPYNERSQKRLQHVGKFPDESILEPFLKKCFCSFRTNKYAKQKTLNKFSTKNTMTKDRASSLTSAVVNYMVPPPNYANLLPYECEPNFCTPGQCEPTVCLERIKMRNRGLKDAGTMSISPRKSTATITSSLSTKSAATFPGRNRRRDSYQDTDSLASCDSKGSQKVFVDTSKSSPGATKSKNKSAVKIGSNFSFQIEFYKTKEENDNCREVEVTPLKPMKERRLKLADRHVMTRRDKPRFRTRRVGRRRKLSDGMSQKSQDIDSKETGTEPFLKRCFCTLKLQKDAQWKEKKINTSELDRYPNLTETKMISTQTKYVKPPTIPAFPDLLPYECEPNFCVPGQCNPIVCDERIKKRNLNLLKRCFCTLKFQNPDQGREAKFPRRSIGTETMKEKKQTGLLPYECEPGICVPDHCDPYECLELINKRNMADASHQTKAPNRRKSVFSATSNKTCDESQCAYYQTHDQGHSPRRKRKTRDSYSSASRPKKEVRPKTEYVYSSSPDRSHSSRQSVKIGSQLSFQIEFFKGNNSKECEEPSRPNKISKEKKKKMKDKSNYPQGFRISRDTGHGTREFSTRDSQAGDIAQRENKSSLTESKLQRCFCTLKLQKRGHFQKKYNVYSQQTYFNKSPFLRNSRSILTARKCRACLCLHKNIMDHSFDL